MCSVFAGALKNQTYDRCSRWGPARRIMQNGKPYSIPRTPYIAAILDSRAKRNWVMKCSQSGLTEGGVTISLFTADYEGRDVIYYFPTKKMAERFSKTRFSPAIELSPHLKRVCTANTAETKIFGNATIHILGAGSITDLIGTAAGRLCFDELDKWTDRQRYLAEQRARGQEDDDVIIWGFSTPEFPGCGIHKEYLRSTQEHFFFPCPHCREHIVLARSDDPKSWIKSFELFGTSPEDPDVHKSYIKCNKCQGKLDHATKKEWLADGYWASIDTDGKPVTPKPELFKTSRGFYLLQLYSTTVEPYLIAIDYLKGIGDEDARREFHNSVLGLPYIEDSRQVTDVHIKSAVEKFGLYSLAELGPFTKHNSFITLGIDQGGPLHSFAAIDWKFDRRKIGDPCDRANGRLVGLGQILQEDWGSEDDPTGIYALMRMFAARRCVIDALPEPVPARAFARSFPGFVWLCQYNTGRGSGREVRLTEDEYGANVVKVDKAGWLSKSLGRVMNGGISFPLDLPLTFEQQIKAPVRTLKRANDGTRFAEYVATGNGEDHYAHTLTYAEIALKILDPTLNPDEEIKG